MSGAGISFVTGSGALKHNNRTFIHENVDSDRVKNNINYKEESLENAYKNCFGDALERYNQKQTRNDRKIKNYIQQIKKSGNNEKLFYENVVQIGDKYSHGFGSGNEQQAIDILDKYAKDFQDRNPNLYVFNMKMHLDEASPHLHIDYIPVATGYKRGLDTRNSLTKAHQNMGISKGTSRNDNSTMKWQERERDNIKAISKEHNLEIINKKTDRKHLTVDEYKVYAEEIQKQYDRAINLELKIKPVEIPFTEKVIIEKNAFEKLSNNEKYSYITEKTLSFYTEKFKGKESEVNSLADELRKKDNHLNLKTDVFKKFVLEKREDIDGLKNKYLNLYDKQLNLNKINESIENENKTLKAALQRAKPLEQDVDNLAHNLTNVIQAVNLFLYDENDNYKLKNIPEKQENLIKALEDYSKIWLKRVDRNDLVEEIEKRIGISEGIEQSIEHINKLNKQENIDLGIGGR